MPIIDDLFAKAVIIKTAHEPKGFISPIFVRPKKDGTTRMIFNLNALNEHVEYHHSKMDTLKDAVRLMKPIVTAYYSVPIAHSHQKYFKFEWDNNLYAFTCFPNGLAFGPRKFTKLLKPVYSVLRRLGHVSSSYIDDSYLQGDNYNNCLANIIDNIRLLYMFGFIIHPVKSVLIPTNEAI